MSDATPEERWKMVFEDQDILEDLRILARCLADEDWAADLFPYLSHPDGMLLSTASDHWKAVQAPGVQFSIDKRRGVTTVSFQDRFGRGDSQEIEGVHIDDDLMGRIRAWLPTTDRAN